MKQELARENSSNPSNFLSKVLGRAALRLSAGEVSRTAKIIAASTLAAVAAIGAYGSVDTIIDHNCDIAYVMAPFSSDAAKTSEACILNDIYASFTDVRPPLPGDMPGRGVQEEPNS